MADEDSKTKKTVKEGLSQAAKEALERASATPPPVEAKVEPAAEKKSEPPKAKAASEPPKATAKSEPPPAKAASNPPPAKASEPPAAKAKSDHPPKKETPFRDGGASGGKRTALLLAEYPTPGACMHAAEALRDAGYTKFDAHTPFPVHGMDKAMGLPDSKLGWIVLCCGLTGVTAAFSMMYWMNCVDYPLIVGGKPPDIGSVPSMIPIMFELTVLFSSFGAVFGMFHLNRLPRHHHPVFESDRFGSFSDDKFFISVEAEDPKFKMDRTRELLEKTHPTFVEVVEEGVS